MHICKLNILPVFKPSAMFEEVLLCDMPFVVVSSPDGSAIFTAPFTREYASSEINFLEYKQRLMLGDILTVDIIYRISFVKASLRHVNMPHKNMKSIKLNVFLVYLQISTNL